MKNMKPQTIYLKDYNPPAFIITAVSLNVDLNEDITNVKSIMHIERNPQYEGQNQSLVLDGEDLRLVKILLDGKELAANQYHLDNESLTIEQVPEKFILETEVEIKPQENTKLSGLYKSGGNFCTQCESHGFRRITYFIDRPDVLTYFTTTIIADKDRYPFLLSNGNLMERKDLPNNKHWVKWHDPSLKPCYLFALVAGNFDYIEDEFITISGRKVQLFVYVGKGKKDQASYAMESLKNAMRWDEKAFGREYDLDIYMIVSVNDFNFGAMENKGLNIFNDKYILAKQETATDEDFINVEAVIGHEYFHNWSGNRVTVRDWFQITLKEGFTVFRDESFTADMHSKAVKRIQDVKVIRNAQFPQDAGPLAHPIYPDSYIEINNFYTVTVYQKGAEVIRMIQTILGPKLFRKGTDLYFSRHDGKAVTVEEFVKAMEDASGIDLSQFRRWYKQAGTPVVNIKDSYDADQRIYSLTVTQECAPTPGQPQKEDFHIPLAVGLLDASGHNIPLQLTDDKEPQFHTTRVLNVKNKTQTYKFYNVTHRPIPSLLRNFSAPVKLNYNYSNEDLIFLLSHDSDEFNRWDAGQKLAINNLLSLIEDAKLNKPLRLDHALLEAFAMVFNEPGLDKALIAEMLILPSENYLIELSEEADVDAIHRAREFARRAIAETLKEQFLEFYHQHSTREYSLSAQAMAERRLKNLCLNYLSLLGDNEIHQLCLHQFKYANNMTDTMGAIISLIDIDCLERTEAIMDFYSRWQHEALVVDKWFSLQAQSSLPSTLDVVKSLLLHPAFDIKNPNKVRALIGMFASQNNINFHTRDGSGYVFLADQVLRINEFNPQLAARILEPLTRWRKFDKFHQLLMHQQLERISNAANLSKDVYEIVSKSL